MGPINAEILENTALGPDCRRLVLAFPRPVTAAPGQFLQVLVAGGTDPLLRRPLSIAGVKARRVTIYYQVAGRGTALLAGREPGETVSVLGPLGRPYPVPPGAKILLGGGLGAASLLFLAARIPRRDRGKTSVFLGARDRACHFLLPAFRALGYAPACATDDGSLGRAGVVTCLADETCAAAPGPATIYACGPPRMLSEVARTLSAPERLIYVSLETMMACGFGVCHGCAVPTRHGYRKACVDGPVFDASDILWDQYAGA